MFDGEIGAKLRSDRLWALLGFVAIVILNAVFDFGLEDAGAEGGSSPLIVLMWSVVAFIGAKTVRSSWAGKLIEGGLASAVVRIEDVPAVRGMQGKTKTVGDILRDPARQAATNAAAALDDAAGGEDTDPVPPEGTEVRRRR